MTFCPHKGMDQAEICISKMVYFMDMFTCFQPLWAALTSHQRTKQCCLQIEFTPDIYSRYTKICEQFIGISSRKYTESHAICVAEKLLHSPQNYKEQPLTLICRFKREIYTGKNIFIRVFNMILLIADSYSSKIQKIKLLIILLSYTIKAHFMKCNFWTAILAKVTDYSITCRGFSWTIRMNRAKLFFLCCARQHFL